MRVGCVTVSPISVSVFQSVSEHQQWEHAPAPGPGLHPAQTPHRSTSGPEVTRPAQWSAEPRDAAGAPGPRQTGDKDRGEEHEQTGPGGEALSRQWACTLRLQLHQTKERIMMMNLFIKYYNSYLKLIVLSWLIQFVRSKNSFNIELCQNLLKKDWILVPSLNFD